METLVHRLGTICFRTEFADRLQIRIRAKHCCSATRWWPLEIITPSQTECSTHARNALREIFKINSPATCNRNANEPPLPCGTMILKFSAVYGRGGCLHRDGGNVRALGTRTLGPLLDGKSDELWASCL